MPWDERARVLLQGQLAYVSSPIGFKGFQLPASASYGMAELRCLVVSRYSRTQGGKVAVAVGADLGEQAFQVFAHVLEDFSFGHGID